MWQCAYEYIVTLSNFYIRQEHRSWNVAGNDLELFGIDTIHSTYGTEKEKGSGSGLTLFGESINKHGGEIVVKSEVGVESEFIISLPSLL